tara:strand:- start:443 stop:712 length:270 start_codon:yes stop_codon:yes gene_type:complete
MKQRYKESRYGSSEPKGFRTLSEIRDSAKSVEIKKRRAIKPTYPSGLAFNLPKAHAEIERLKRVDLVAEDTASLEHVREQMRKIKAKGK